MNHFEIDNQISVYKGVYIMKPNSLHERMVLIFSDISNRTCVSSDTCWLLSGAKWDYSWSSLERGNLKSFISNFSLTSTRTGGALDLLHMWQWVYGSVCTITLWNSAVGHAFSNWIWYEWVRVGANWWSIYSLIDPCHHSATTTTSELSTDCEKNQESLIQHVYFLM